MPKKVVTHADRVRADRMKALRELAGLTQGDIDPNRSTVIRVEQGANQLTGGALISRYARAFGVSGDDITSYRDGGLTADQVLAMGATFHGTRKNPRPMRYSRKPPPGPVEPGAGPEEWVEVRELDGWENAIRAAQEEMGGDDELFRLAGFVRLPRLPSKADVGLAKTIVFLLQGYCKGSGVRQRVGKK